MQDSFMFQNRFSSGIGGYGMGSRFGHNTFDMPTSAQYRQFHEMKAEMPSDVLQLFKANQVGFIKAPVKPKCRSLDPILTMGINLMQMFQIPNLQLIQQQKPQTKQQRLSRIAIQKRQLNQNRIRAQLAQWNPFQEIKTQSDPQKTLFVGRLNYNTTQKTLKFQFEKYGIIKKVFIVKDQNGKSRGYGFVEFDSKEDFISAYKQANNRKIDDRRIIVDYQRGRTLLNWRPRRFGGGAGQSRMTKQQLEVFKNQEKQKKITHANDASNNRAEKRRSPDNHQRSRSPRKQKRRQQYDDKDRNKGRFEKERREMGDRADRGYRGDRNDRGDRGDRGQRGQRSQRGDRGQRGDRNNSRRQYRR